MLRLRLRFTVRRLMLVVAAVAILLGATPPGVRAVRHFSGCRRGAEWLEHCGRLDGALALRYRGCPGSRPLGVEELCQDPCLPHWDYDPSPPWQTERFQAEVAAAHEARAEIYRRASAAYLRHAGRLRAWPWEPRPSMTDEERNACDAASGYLCDMPL